MGWANDKAFEAEVLRIARAKWPKSAMSGSTKLEGRERDGVFESDETIHFIEATTSRQAEKARQDTKKMHSAIVTSVQSNPIKGARGWFVTAEEPTADQRDAVKKFGKGQVVAVSFAQFQQSIVDVGQYLEARAHHLFGSVLDPETKQHNPKLEYIPINFSSSDEEQSWNIRTISSGLLNGDRFILTGEFGAGKSMSLRQIFFQLRDEYLQARTSIFPIYINLREHTGQSEAVEVIERHARKIGFDSPSSLVKAWRAKFVTLILDGFDELTSLGVQRASYNNLKIIRRRALEAVRQIITETPEGVGIITAGRDHFFATDNEMASALGLENYKLIKTTDFTKEQIIQFLKRQGASEKNVMLPSWLPTKPLLISYLASSGLLSEVSTNPELHTNYSSWDYLIDRICEREARIDNRYLDGPTLRKILSRLSTYARVSDDGLGPLAPQQLSKAFQEICGFEADDQAWIALQRLPGLATYEVEADTKKFIDDEMVQVYRSGDIMDFIQDPYTALTQQEFTSAFSQIGSTAGDYAIDVCIKKCPPQTVSSIHAIMQLLQGHPSLNSLKADIATLSIHASLPIKYTCEIEGVFFSDVTLNLENTIDLSGLTFSNCYFSIVEVDNNPPENLPTFKDCIITEISGYTNSDDLPKIKFLKTEIQEYSNQPQTNAAIRNESISTGEKVLLIILRKIFLQSLGGRSESALYRGLSTSEKQLVDPLVNYLHQEGYLVPITRGGTSIWGPVRKHLHNIRRIIGRVESETPELLDYARRLSG
ncbi:ATP-binding protein [Pseudomonas aeruginosa]|uniref:NACHT domain-containing protein n=1 Tax=Pseudomonas aeruginosa TaxID=287 RepID=UPI001BDE63D2|nr:ATP-binding protein [Pseudomonas aeruginosa]MBW8261053.1 ATP-binding protein [Pseudomonas aeruginosa]MBW8277613.1 ATP-binding protein [Pseudomonas aeruginosa]UEM31797.1 ATP-binding protein [Pseudomonas aeruginosa]